jgi:hypothetical protein
MRPKENKLYTFKDFFPKRLLANGLISLTKRPITEKNITRKIVIFWRGSSVQND